MTASNSFMYPQWEPGWRFFHVVEPLNLNSYRFLFIPVSDAEALCREGGSHWSFLVFDKDNNTFYYCDSLKGKNYASGVCSNGKQVLLVYEW